MNEIRIIGIDPSLRNTGYCQLIFNTDNKKIRVQNCGVILNPAKYKGIDALESMIEMLTDLSESEWIAEAHHVIVESPPPTRSFSASFQAGAMIGVAHIAGAAAALMNINRVKMVQPVVWNRAKKKEYTQKRIQQILGDFTTWEYDTKVKDKYIEHVIDAVGMAYWFLNETYLQEKEKNEIKDKD